MAASAARYGGNLLLHILEYFHEPELVGSGLVIYVIHAVSQTTNIPHLFLNGLKVIIAPTEETVLKLRPDAKGPRPEPLREKEQEGKEPDAYDKMNALGLVRLEVSKGTLSSLAYFGYFNAMVLWSLVALANFLVSEGSRCAAPTKRTIGWTTLTLSAALIRAVWCNVRLVGLLGLDNDHGKFALFCGFCGLFLAAACAAMSPADFFFFDVRGVATGLHLWASEVVEMMGLRGAGLNEDDFTAIFLPMVALLAAGVTAAAALPSIRFAQFYHRALERGSGASLCHRALLVADLLLPWLTTLVWVRPVVSLPVFGRLFAGHGLEGAARAAAMASWGVRVWVTAATAGLRLAVGRRQLQMFLDGVKEAVLQDLREKKVSVYAVRSKFEARFQYLVIAAAQYAAPALTILLSLALLIHAGGGGGHGGDGGLASPGFSAAHYANIDNAFPLAASAGGAGIAIAGNTASIGICDAARRVVGAPAWHEAVAAGRAAAAAAMVVEGYSEGDGLVGVVGGQRGGSEGEGAEMGAGTAGDRGSSSSGGGVGDDDGENRALSLSCDNVEECASTEATEAAVAGGVRVNGVIDEGSMEVETKMEGIKGSEEVEPIEKKEGGLDVVVGKAIGGIPRLPEAVWSGALGFLLWWACLSWAMSYSIGVVFWRLYPEDTGVKERAPRDRTTKGKRGEKDGRGKGKGKGKAAGVVKGGA